MKGSLFALLIGLFAALGSPWTWQNAGKRLRAVALGLCLPALAVVSMKIGFASDNDAVTASTGDGFALLLDFDRWATITSTLAQHFARDWVYWVAIPLVAAALLLQQKRDRWGDPRPLIILTAMLGIYLFIYLTTTRELEWLLSTSLDRLVLQLWPAIVLGLIVLRRTPAPSRLD